MVGKGTKLAAAIGLAGLMSTVGATAYASAHRPVERDTFTRMWGHGPVATVIVRNGCIDAEDSAGHLRLRRYGDGVAVYGCHRRGY